MDRQTAGGRVQPGGSDEGAARSAPASAPSAAAPSAAAPAAADQAAADQAAADQAAAEPEAGRRSGGRRYRAGRPLPEPPQAGLSAADPLAGSAYWRPRADGTPFPAGVRTAGTLAGLLAICLLSCLLAAWLHRGAVAGLGFCAGSGLAARYARPAALLRVVISLPVVFLVAEVATQLVTLPGGGRRGTAAAVLEGTLLVLAGVAPWLFAGTAGAVAIALFRGLPRCIRDLRAELSGRARDRRG